MGEGGSINIIGGLAVARSSCTVCTRRIRWSCEGLTSIPQQIHWIQLKHLLPMTMYNLSLPNLMCYNYCGLPTAACVEMLPRWCLTGDCPGTVLYLAMVYSLDRKVHFGTVHCQPYFWLLNFVPRPTFHKETKLTWDLVVNPVNLSEFRVKQRGISEIKAETEKKPLKSIRWFPLFHSHTIPHQRFFSSATLV